MRFEGKSVIVTGAGGGLGAQTALDFAAEGADVVAVDINEAALAELQDRAAGLAGKINPYA